MVKAAWDRVLALLKKQRQAGHVAVQVPSEHRGHAGARLRCSPRCRGCSTGCGARLAVTLVLVCSMVMVGLNFDYQILEGLLLWVKENKLQGSALFLGLYTVAIVLMVPAMVMAMCAGAIFGALAGSLIVWVGSSVGQVLAFMVGRYLLREAVLQFLTEQYPKWGAIDRALEREGWKLVTLLRLSPIAPWNVLNYALAVTAVPVGSYALASSLAILPYLVMFVYLGSLARTLSDIFGGLAGPDTGTTILLGAVSGVLLVAIVWWTTQMAKKAIREALVDEADGPIADNASAEMDVLCMLRGHQGAGPGSAGSAGDDPEGLEEGECNSEGAGEFVLLRGLRRQEREREEGGKGRGGGMGVLADGNGGWGTGSGGGGVAATVHVVGPGAGGGEHEVQLVPLLGCKEGAGAAGVSPRVATLAAGGGGAGGKAHVVAVSPRVPGVTAR